MKRNRLLVSVVASISVLALATACGSGSDENKSNRPAVGSDGQFPDVNFGDLESPLRWYDTSGGSITEAKESTIFKTFTDVTGVSIEGQRDVGMTKFMAAAQAGKVPWSWVEFSTIGDLLRAEKAGYLAKLDTSIVPVDKLDPGSYDDYAVYGQRFGIVMIWNTEKWPESGKHPESMTDLFNTEDFPGKRCFYKGVSAGGTFETPLLASGVAPGDLYPLDTEAAFAELDKIKKDIVWWDNGDDSIRYVIDGECDLGVAWSGRAYDAIEKQGLPLGMTWKDALYSSSPLAIPAGAPNMEAGQALMAMWILDKQGQKDYTGITTYGTPITGLDYGADLGPYVATGKNAEVAIEENASFYLENSDELTELFNAWLVK